jgi:PKD repeat protein
VIIGANAFDASGTPPFAHILVGAKPPPGTIGVCAAPSFTVFGSTSAPLITPAGNLASSPEPATISDTTSTVGYVIAADDDDTGSGSNLAVWQIGGTATAPTLSAPHDVPVSGFAAPPGVPQPGSSDTIDTLDSRLTQAVAAADPSDGGAETVWTQHTVSDGAGGSVVRWYEVAPATTTLVQSGTITNGPAGSFAFNGAIAPTRSGGAVIDYNTGGSTQDVKLLAQSRAATDAAGTMSSPITLATSSAIDSDFSCPSQPFGSVQGNGFCRWGDYAGASVDPDNQDVAWGSNQVNGPTGASIPGFGDQAQWRTQNFALTPSATSAPTASFTFSPNPVSPGSPVSFDASASNDPNSGGGITDFTWHFGDGTAQDTGTTAIATHNYVAAGVYTVTLTVTASHGTSTTMHVVTVDAPPSASFTAAPNPVTPGGAVSFNASGSTDPNPGGTIAAYSWSFGDGTGASGATPAHAYGAPGAYPVTLTITDDHGQTASQTQTVIVDQPSATFTAAPNPTIPGATVAFNAGASNDAIASISAYSWSFGDGTGATGATPSHAYSAPGSYVVTLVVTNNFGQTATSSTVVTVDAPPTASFTIVPNPATVGTPVGFNASGSTAPPGVSAGYTWAFGDGGTASGPVVSHSYTSPGTYAVTLIVVDSDGQSATTIERVTIVPRPPGKPPPLTGRLSMRHQRVAAIRKHGLVVTLSTNQGRQATFRIIARIKPSRAGRKQTSLTLLRGRTLTVASGTHRLVLKLSKASARALASKHVTSLTVTVVVVDAFGQKLTRSASFRL